MNSKHTPTPWELSTKFIGHIFDKRGRLLAGCMGSSTNNPNEALTIREEQAANAAFICRAVNSHDALVEALKNTLPAFESLYLDQYDAKNYGVAGELFDILEQARAALAAAKGGDDV